MKPLQEIVEEAFAAAEPLSKNINTTFEQERSHAPKQTETKDLPQGHQWVTVPTASTNQPEPNVPMNLNHELLKQNPLELEQKQEQSQQVSMTI